MHRARATLIAVAVVTAVGGRLAGAQQFTPAGPSAGLMLMLPGGRIVMLDTAAAGVTIKGIMTMRMGGDSAGAPQAPAIDLQRGDRVLEFAHVASPTLADVRARWEAIAPGADVELTVERGGQRLAVTFPKPARPSGPRMAMAAAPGDSSSTGAARGSGAWVTADQAGAAVLSIAGYQIRRSESGEAVVALRTAHPAQAAVALEPGDRIDALAGTAVKDFAGFRARWDAVQVGTQVALTVTRDGKQVTVSLAKPAP
jgi:S1-C subfamily serine protease